MAVPQSIHKYIILFRNPRLIFLKSKYLFVISHMRSRSSVLSHILGNNPEIIGYRELHRSYRRSIDLLRIKVNLFIEFNNNLEKKYLLDRILHNQNDISEKILKSPENKIIILIRRPEESIKSILNLTKLTGNPKFDNIEYALDYYCSRLDYLKNLAIRIPGKYYFIESGELLESTSAILEDLSIWLNLSKKLENRYSTFKMTRTKGGGDPSENIKKGRLFSTRQNVDIHLPLEYLHKGEAAYNKCKQVLIENRAIDPAFKTKYN